MFSPARGKLPAGVRSRERRAGVQGVRSPAPRPPSAPASPATPATPLVRTPEQFVGYGAPTTITPWAAQATQGAKVTTSDDSQPVFVSDFPKQVRSHGDRQFGPGVATLVRLGGMDATLGLSWLLQGEHIYVWSHLEGHASHECAVLTIPAEVSSDARGDVKHGDHWLVCLVEQHEDRRQMGLMNTFPSVSVVLLNQKTLAVAYWPQAFRVDGYCSAVLVTSGADECGNAQISDANRRPIASWSGGSGSGLENQVKSMVASAVSGTGGNCCVAIAGKHSGELYRFNCSPDQITRQQIVRSLDELAKGIGIISLNSSSMRCLAWRSPLSSRTETWRQLLLLTAKGVECWDVELGGGSTVCFSWSHDFIVDNSTSSTEKARDSVQNEFAGRKQVWLLDLQVEARGNEFTVLVASFCKDRINNSSYMQYSLLTFFLHGASAGKGVGGLSTLTPPVEKKASMQVILPKARVEEEAFLYSMRLRIGGKPAGSFVITAGDGTATVAHSSWNGSLRLYQFSAPWDVGKVLDVSVVPLENGDEGSWLVLTEKAGVWVIPEKVVLLGGVEPPRRNLSRRESLIEEAANEERKKQAVAKIVLSRASSETGLADTETVQERHMQDDETEEIVGRVLQQFASVGHVDNALEKLRRAFEREGDLNAFTQTSKSIVDTLGKHWTRGADAGTSIVSSQFVEKQSQHQQYLNFLAASGCHEVLQTRQRESLQIILEHGEKLAAIIKLRELHNSQAKNRNLFHEDIGDRYNASKSNELVGALWDTVQLVGAKLRRNNAILMNREKAEVFYSRVSEVEEFFTCLEHHGETLIEQDHRLQQQAERLVDLADACTMSLRAAIQYRDSHQLWYPSPEGLTPWYCSPTVRAGLWKIALCTIRVKAQLANCHFDMAQELCTRLEEVSDMMLEAYAGAIKAKEERGEEFRDLQTEYGMKRDVLLGALHQQAMGMVSAGNLSDLRHETVVLEKIHQSLIDLAQRHAGYQTLYEMCADLNDSEQLRHLMRESMGVKDGSFCHYVFKQCYKDHQYARLLTLGEEFHGELEAFLHDHQDLAWLHHVFLDKLSSACHILHSLALSNSDVLEVGKGGSHHSSERILEPLTLEERKHMMYLAKLAALAAEDCAGEVEFAVLDAHIAILDVQEKAVQAGIIGDRVLSPRELIEACMKLDYKELVVSVFDVFAFAGEDFRQGNKSLLENAWVWAADQDKWSMMRQLSEDKGWSDEQHLHFLQNTALCQAAMRCHAEGEDGSFGGSFEETLPLFHSEDRVGSSVEVILMRHPDFSFAGRAMLTALRLGAERDNVFSVHA